MTRHDAAITTWSQWVKRVFRGGHAFAEGAFLHGASDERYNIRQTRSAVLWGIAMPISVMLITLLAVFADARMSLLLTIPILAWLLLAYRIYRHSRLRGRQPRLCLMETMFCILAKTPEACGVIRFWTNQRAGRRSKLIEYK